MCETKLGASIALILKFSSVSFSNTWRNFFKLNLSFSDNNKKIAHVSAPTAKY